jgi:hypothetical protein
MFFNWRLFKIEDAKKVAKANRLVWDDKPKESMLIIQKYDYRSK